METDDPTRELTRRIEERQRAVYGSLPGRDHNPPAVRKREAPKKKPTEKPKPERPQALISPMQAAERLGLLQDKVVRDPRLAVLKMARRGELVAVKVGRCTRIRPESVDAWISGEA